MRAAVRLAGAVLACALTLTGCGAVRRAVAAPTTGASGPELVLGPTGIGKLRLGMTTAQAAATGEAKGYPVTGTSTCSFEEVNGVTIGFSPRHGLALLGGPPQTRTPQGIRIGSTFAEATAAYPTIAYPDLGDPAEQVRLLSYLAVPVPDNPDATYILFFGFGRTNVKDAKVQLMMLSLRNQDHDCTHAG